jgi:hypothetical protein
MIPPIEYDDERMVRRESERKAMLSEVAALRERKKAKNGEGYDEPLKEDHGDQVILVGLSVPLQDVFIIVFKVFISMTVLGFFAGLAYFFFRYFFDVF